ncbi:MAG: response regulator [Propionibacteriaceae bacterium]|nr:response regulator [Propionibacteriaceae bacterium]
MTESVEPKARILLYSSDHNTRDSVKLALGTKLADDLPELEIFEVATEPEVWRHVDKEHFDLLILDGEANPSGGAGIAFTTKNEYKDPPPVLLLVARVPDAWIATWSKAEAVALMPIDPFKFAKQVEELLRAELAFEN